MQIFFKAALSGQRKGQKKWSFAPEQEKTYNYQNAVQLLPYEATPTALRPEIGGGTNHDQRGFKEKNMNNLEKYNVLAGVLRS